MMGLRKIIDGNGDTQLSEKIRAADGYKPTRRLKTLKYGLKTAERGSTSPKMRFLGLFFDFPRLPREIRP